ncbi:hypothetical protein AC579_432 [Pseudocercospora musae]|uniref:Uncharacterized protein n=1 Tax=Pseudocercospora musae TaxID=113226 RepID=A0A139GT64_9PEZI|nr:hypothetical protein AC579_432 [Pseudocercospora musae]
MPIASRNISCVQGSLAKISILVTGVLNWLAPKFMVPRDATSLNGGRKELVEHRIAGVILVQRKPFSKAAMLDMTDCQENTG